MIFIYQIRNLVNSKVYVGKTRDVDLRFQQHIESSVSGDERHLYASMRHYGIENFVVDVLEENLHSEEAANEQERAWIRKLNSFDRRFGYNLTPGGDGVTKHRDETRAKMSKSHLGKHPNHETRKKMSQSQKGRIFSDEHKKKMSSSISCALTGRNLTETHKKHISDSTRGKYVTPETGAKISCSRKGMKFSVEHRRKLSVAHKGRKLSDETRKKMSEAQKNRRRKESDGQKKKIT